MTALPLGVRGRMFARLLIIQATWSFERMQGLGFAYALEPWLERVYPRQEDRCRALARHMEFFNTQPYVAAPIAGVVCAMEQRAAGLPEHERAAAYARMALVKKAAGSSLAALGDSFFWGALRPSAAAAGLAAGLLALQSGRATAGLWTAGVYLAVYNAPVLWLRWRGLQLGFEWGENIPSRLKEHNVQAWLARLRLGGALAAASLIVGALAGAQSGQRVVGALALATFWTLYFLLADRASALRFYTAVCVVGFLTAIAGWF